MNYDYDLFVIGAGSVGVAAAERAAKYGACYTKTFQPLFNLMAESKLKTLLKFVVVEGESERVVGAHMVGNYAAEIIEMIALATKAGVTKKDFDSTIGIHPMIGEEFFTMR